MDLYEELRKGDVLVVEDDPWTREALATFFAVEGVRCTAVETVEEGLEALRERGYDVIVCEHWLSGADGLWFLKVADSADPKSVKVLISAYPTAAIRRETARHRAIAFLAKPFRVAALERLLAREFEERRRRTGALRDLASRPGEPQAAGALSAAVKEIAETEGEGGIMARELVDRVIRGPGSPQPAAESADGPTVVVTDAAGTVVSVGGSFDANEGYSRYDVLGKNVADLRRGDGDRRLYRMIWYLVRRDAFGVEAPARLAESGDRRTIDVLPLCNALGQVTHYVAVRRRPAAGRPSARAAETPPSPARLGRVAAGISHELNNQLCVILGYAEVLLGRAGEGERPEPALIRDAAARIAATSRRLLAYAQMQPMRPERTDLNAVVTSFVDAFAGAAGSGIEVRAELAPDLGGVDVDRELIGQVLGDLAESASATMPGGGTLTLRTANLDLAGSFVRQDVYIRRGRYVTFSLHHTGEVPGLETSARIFEPFSAGLEEPRGLLLPAVYGGVKQCGGYIWASARPGHGTTFNIYLPRTEGT